ncbi:MAG: hypothetical protein PUP93_05045 [Rhizonema sp. NSF051]|nr:hypothetical protein [Rhizonema sp. NSF051]
MTKTTSSIERLSPKLQISNDLISHQECSNEVGENISNAPVESTVQSPLGRWQIVHSMTGRIRIRATENSPDLVLKTISEILQQHDGVKEVSVHERTGSLVVKFDENKLSSVQILELLQQGDMNQHHSSPSASNTDPFAAWRSTDFWKEQGISLIPLMTGLAVTGGLGINGLVAIPVYMLTADATRRIIDCFEPFSTSESNAKSSHVEGESSKGKIPVENRFTSPATADLLKEKKNTELTKPQEIAYTVVHSIPGRIRFNVPRISRDQAYARRLERLLKIDPQVTSVRVNCDAASIAILHKLDEIPITHWVNLLELADETSPQTIPIETTSAETLAQKVSVPNEAKELTETTRWVDFKAPALSAVLDFIANFPLDPVPD